MDFKDYLTSSAVEIEEEINLEISKWVDEAGTIHDSLIPLFQLFKDASEGGKRLRGTLVKLGYDLTGQEYTNSILKPAAAVEILQTGLLTQDDVIDKSPTRRGRPTIYRQLGGDHYAISQAIVLGDTALFIANKLISDSDFPPEIKNKALSAFSRMVIYTVFGEMLDVELPRLKEKTEEAVVKIHRLKTSFYTITYPLQLGAILGGGDDNLISSFEVFGENLGIAFQIQDDILGVFGDEKTLGKSVTSDIEEGKNTLLITYALEHVDEQQKKFLDDHYGKGKIDDSIHQEIKKIFTDTGALEYSKAKALEYVSIAKEVIPEITSNPEHAALLVGLADFLINRDK